MRQSIRIGRVAGVDVGMSWSVLVIFGLLTWELATVVFPPASPFGGSVGGARYWVAGALAALTFFLSLLAHEVSHAVVARRNGVGVRSITLWLFGGVAQLEGEAHTAGADFRIAAVGPATSIAAAGLFAGVQAVTVAAGGGGLPVDVLSWLWKINLLLAAFNLIPAAPLDGGRILRSGLWRHWGDRGRASVAAARAGRGFGVVLVVLGGLEFATGGLYGIWPLVLGVFLYSAATSEERTAVVRSGLDHVPVGEVMARHPLVAPGWTTVAALAEQGLWHYRGDTVVLTDQAGWLAGAVGVAQLRAVPADRQATTTLWALGTPLAGLAVARPEEPMGVLLERMALAGAPVALVLGADNRLAGVVSPSDIERAAALARFRQPVSV
jgi:Zn-dependent protease